MTVPPRLLVFTREDVAPARLAFLLPAMAGIVDAVVLRWPGLSVRAREVAAIQLAAVSPRPPLLAAGRADLARAAALDGVHLRDDGLSPREVRAWCPGVLGASRHADSILTTRDVDYATLGPVFATASKPGAPGLGLDRIAALVEASSVPVLGLGGIDAARAPEVVAAGAAGVAVVGAAWDAPDPILALTRLRRRLTG